MLEGLLEALVGPDGTASVALFVAPVGVFIPLPSTSTYDVHCLQEWTSTARI